MADRFIFTVAELTRHIRDTLESAYPDVWVEGEISNLRIPSSGHCYFTLKDEAAQLRVVMFRMQARLLRFTAEDGLKVICRGRINVYEQRGEYQLVADMLEPRGVGSLQLAFEQLKNRLAGEGLFAEERKKPLPFLPARIAVITSPTGAAVRDIIRIIHRRFPSVAILVVPVRVQGDEAPEEIARAIETVNQRGLGDVIIVGRGGGSLEDLWAFNTETVARAIAASALPVISAVGHETDTTIADFAADLRAPTPSAAAELVVP
ncbi:MAG: exodeoxyribonuclease VII large subunit, partial [Deltaproteobacteria bacterium]|nr:exodeoxyribonuclease VII large subunit [Deltaproteobacteria bacterium]